jgi:hypothetical protein
MKIQCGCKRTKMVLRGVQTVEVAEAVTAPSKTVRPVVVGGKDGGQIIRPVVTATCATCCREQQAAAYAARRPRSSPVAKRPSRKHRLAARRNSLAAEVMASVERLTGAAS